jgi:16S rRNA processing protein RimM
VATGGEHAPLQAGHVGRAHGLDGSFYVTRPVARLLVAGNELTVDGDTAAIVRRAGTEARPIVRLAGIDSREAAEALRGKPLFMESARRPELGQNEYWAHELEGCAIFAAENRLGVVVRMIELPSCEALQVELVDGGELIVPMVRDAITDVDIGARRIAVNGAFLGVQSP